MTKEGGDDVQKHWREGSAGVIIIGIVAAFAIIFVIFVVFGPTFLPIDPGPDQETETADELATTGPGLAATEPTLEVNTSGSIGFGASAGPERIPDADFVYGKETRVTP